MTDQEKVGRLPAGLQTYGKMLLGKQLTEMPQQPEKGKWYRLYAEGTFCAFDEPYHACFKSGTENKLLIIFCGGGVSINAYTAAHPNSVFNAPGAVNFYTDDVFLAADLVPPHGLGADRADNPFRNWSALFVPYATGDFHCGENDFSFRDDAGAEKVVQGGLRRHDGDAVLPGLLKVVVGVVEEEAAEALLPGVGVGGQGIDVGGGKTLPLGQGHRHRKEGQHGPHHAVLQQEEDLAGIPVVIKVVDVGVVVPEGQLPELLLAGDLFQAGGTDLDHGTCAPFWRRHGRRPRISLTAVYHGRRDRARVSWGPYPVWRVSLPPKP